MTSNDQSSHHLEFNEAPIVAPPSASHGVVLGTARGAAFATDPGVALGVGPCVAPATTPPHIDIDAVFVFAD